MVNEINKIWCSVLGLDEIDNNDAFYDIGGNSISMIMIMDVVNKKYHYELPLTDVYLFDTVNKMADFISENIK